ncbi:DUF4157 domain-containing protein [Isoptericola sp. NPDC057653]|uniref:eCIS core domain-containing protein n=1 Tax=Isoptericola sp. NPDC057653 TaxID=3346195 RepID=UPI0036AD8E08
MDAVRRDREPAAPRAARTRAAGTATGGEPLPEATAAWFGARFGHDFSAVRVHTDGPAAARAQGLGAVAVTSGDDIDFAPGRYAPDTAAGQRLLAHELAHVVQQGGRPPAGAVPDRSGEHAADEAAGLALSGAPARVPATGATGPQLQAGGPGPATQAPLSPDELWKLAQDQRGFESTSGGTGDDYRAKPATVPPKSLAVDASGTPTATGAALGKGYETVAAVQLLDADGRQVDVARGIFHSGGPENHAERVALRALEAHAPGTVPGGRLVVVGDQAICPTCRAALLEYARSRGLTVIEPHEPTRARVRGSGSVSPKTASRSSTQGGKPALTVARRADIPVPADPGHGTTGGGGGTAPRSTPLPRSEPEPAVRPSPRTGTATPQAQSPFVAPVPPRSTGRSTTTEPAPTAGSLRRGTVTVEYDATPGARGRPARVTGIDTSGLSADQGLTLKESSSGEALVTAFSAVQMGRTLLDIASMATSPETTSTIQKVTHPLQSYLRSRITDAQADFLAAHPSTASSGPRADALRLRGDYESAWGRLSAVQARRILAAIWLSTVPEDRRGPDWQAAVKNLGVAGVAPQDLAAFRAAASAYESRMIDALQEVAPYRARLPQLAQEIEQRAGVLQTISDDLDETWWWIIARMPLAFYVIPDLHGESQFVAELAASMRGFARVVRERDQEYQRLDAEFDAQLRQVGRHLADPGSAVNEAMTRRRASQ